MEEDELQIMKLSLCVGVEVLHASLTLTLGEISGQFHVLATFTPVKNHEARVGCE